ncbi:unnamed protein product [Allacma fusca]|uniref:Ricin B lectin domain-containing protein n=1 Tax=Allacma fusca TaxID=39272 RepID=A0A8J2LV69_9HEXA|nr:unnamed protein product [Allacma fusca]
MSITLFRVFLLSVVSFGFVNAVGELLPPGFYRITSVEDGMVLTATDSFGFVPGRQHRLSNVIVAKWKGLSEQEWQVKDSSLGIPEQYTLTSRRFDRNRVSMWAPQKFYEISNEWRFIYLGGEMWQLKNKDTGRCLINWGRFRDVDEWTCDKYANNQRWYMQRLN